MILSIIAHRCAVQPLAAHSPLRTWARVLARAAFGAGAVRPKGRRRERRWAPLPAFATRALHSGGPTILWWDQRRSSVLDFSQRRCSVYFGGGGLLIVLGIIALVLGYTLIGIILIILGLFAGGFGFYGSRRGGP